ncbi:Uma2 family endonuclease [Catellatospora coxensis]
MPHFTTLYRLRRALEKQAPPNIVVGENLGVLRHDGTSYFIPDVVVFDANLLGTTVTALPPAAAKLVIEVVSPSNPSNDLVIKRHGYATLGVIEYWIVDPRAEEVLVLTKPGSGGYLVEEKRTDSMSGTAPFPYQLDLTEIFA